MNNNLRQLRYVTSHYTQLQGLRFVALGIMLLFLLLALRLERPWREALIALLLALLGVTLWRIGAYYHRTLGALDQGSSDRRRNSINLRVIAIVLLVLIAKFVFHLRIAGPEWILGLILGMFWAIEQRRWYYLLFAAGFAAIGVMYRTPHPRLWSVEIWLMPIALIIGGILDHYYLVRSLPGVRSNGNA